jgi:hypothetical protein
MHDKHFTARRRPPSIYVEIYKLGRRGSQSIRVTRREGLKAKNTDEALLGSYREPGASLDRSKALRDTGCGLGAHWPYLRTRLSVHSWHLSAPEKRCAGALPKHHDNAQQISHSFVIERQIARNDGR